MGLAEARLLIVEDSPEQQIMIRRALGQSPRHIYVSSLAEARAQLANEPFELILLDVVLPDGNGLSFCREIKTFRGSESTPVIFLSVKSEPETKALSFDFGATDYIVKPFNVVEFGARIRNRLASNAPTLERVMLNARTKLEVDHRNFTAVLSEGDKRTELSLTPLGFRLLSFFIKNKDAVLTRDRLLDAVWGNDNRVSDRSVDSAVSALRKSLGEAGKSLKGVYGTGYRFVPESSPERSETSTMSCLAAEKAKSVVNALRAALQGCDAVTCDTVLKTVSSELEQLQNKKPDSAAS